MTLSSIDRDVWNAAVEAAAAAQVVAVLRLGSSLTLRDRAEASLKGGFPLLLDALAGRIEAQYREAHRRWMPSPEAYNAFADGRLDGILGSVEVVRSFAREVSR